MPCFPSSYSFCLHRCLATLSSGGMVNQQEVEVGGNSHPLLWSRTDGHKTGYAKPICFGVGAWFPRRGEAPVLLEALFLGEICQRTYVTLVECYLRMRS